MTRCLKSSSLMPLKPISSNSLPRINSGPTKRILSIPLKNKSINSFSLSMLKFKSSCWVKCINSDLARAFNRSNSIGSILVPMVLTVLYLPLLLSIIWMLTVPLLLFFWRINILNKNRATQNYKKISVTNCLSIGIF